MTQAANQGDGTSASEAIGSGDELLAPIYLPRSIRCAGQGLASEFPILKSVVDFIEFGGLAAGVAGNIERFEELYPR
jgi:hypothetical protein